MSTPTKTDIPALKERYLKIIRDNKIYPGFSSIDVIIPDLHGDHFASSCDYVTIHKNGEPPIEIFVKRMVKNPTHMAVIKELLFFEKEAGFFTLIIPALENFVQTRKPSAPYILDILPKCPYADDEMVMLENLVKKGFVLLNKLERQDFEHAAVYMKTLAKYHAPSYLMIKEEGGQEDGGQKFMARFPAASETPEGSERHFVNWFTSSYGWAESILKSTQTDDCEYAARVLKNIKSKLNKLIKMYSDPAHGHVCYVLNHGDSWNNNMMFLHDDKTKEILQHVLVDFQMIGVGSPNLDTSYFMFTSLKHVVRRNKWKDLLKVYYDFLDENVRKLKGTLHFSFEEFVKDYKRKFVWGFMFGIGMSGIVEGMQEMGDMDEMDGDFTEMMNVHVPKWIEANPIKVKESAMVLSGMFQEFQELNLDEDLN